MNKIVNFLKECITEMKKVTWTGKKELVASTLLVVILILIISFFIGLVDFVLASLLKQLIG